MAGGSRDYLQILPPYIVAIYKNYSPVLTENSNGAKLKTSQCTIICILKAHNGKGGLPVSEGLYQKLGIAVNRLAEDFLARQEGERIPSISEYQERLQVSRGTIQNGLSYLKDSGAVSLVSRGHLGTFIERLDYRRLQECSFNKELIGTMPLPYSLCYQGLATALFETLSPYAFNLLYARGAESRLKLLTTGLCQFTVCSRYAAEEAIRCHTDVEIAVDLGPGTYLTSHVLVFREAGKSAIESGMRIGYDPGSVDHRHLTEKICSGVRNVKLVELKAHQTIRAIHSGEIDAGVWNLDDIMESGYKGLNLVPIPQFSDFTAFNSAVLVIRRGDENIAQLLRQCVQLPLVQRIQSDVRAGERPADY